MLITDILFNIAIEAAMKGDEEIKLRKIDELDKKYTIRDKYVPIVEKALPKNEMKLLRWISAYRDKNIDKLSTIYPVSYPIFGPKDNAIVFECAGINPNELAEDIKKVELPEGVEEKANFTPIYTTFILILHYYYKKKKMEKFNVIMYYFAYSMWWSIFSRSFYLGVRAETMEYTINTMNKKFLLKQLGSIDKLLFHGVNTAVSAYYDLLDDLFDASLYYIIDAVKTRLGGYCKNIASKYYEDDKAGNVIMHGRDDDIMKETVSGDADVVSLATKMTTKFFSEKPRKKIVNIVAEIAQISPKELEIVLTMMVDKRETAEVQQFYEAIFYQYLHEDNSDRDLTNKKQFLTMMRTIYRKGHSKNKNDVLIKQLLNKWLEEGSKTYQKTTSGTTLNNYRNGVYLYFIFLVVQK